MEEQLANELAQARQEIAVLRRRLDALETTGRIESLPLTALLNHSYFRRAFAVFGHQLVASLITAIPFYIMMFMILMSMSLLVSLLQGWVRA